MQAANTPEINKALFCPNCHTNSVHRWFIVRDVRNQFEDNGPYIPYTMIDKINTILISKCDNCAQISYWHNDKKIYPQTGDNPPPNSYLPEEITEIYNEANSIANLSDRATRVLLRLALEKLLTHLGIQGDKLYNKIQTLYNPSNQNNQTYEQSEIIRLLGNDAAHAEERIDSDDSSTEFMFNCINLIAEKLIEYPEKTRELHSTVTQTKNNK